jgi:serine/threonine-protein kinase
MLTEKPRVVRLSRPTAPLHVDYAIQRALARLPADRWSSANEFGEALRGRKAVQPIFSGTHAIPRAFPQRLRREMSNPFVIGLGALVIIASSAAAWTWSENRVREVTPTERFLIAPTREVSLPVTQGASVSISPDGGTIAFVARKGVVRNQMFVRRLSDLEPVAIPGTEGAGVPFFSPDGAWLGFMSSQKLRKVSLSTDAMVDIADVGGLPSGLAWVTPDTIVVGLGSELLIQPVAGGSRDTLPRLPGESAREWPRVMGDGEHVLYASWQAGGGLSTARIAVTSVKTRKSTILDVTGVCPLGVVDGMLVFVTAGQDVMAVPFDRNAMRVTGDPVPVERGVLLGGRGSCKAAVSPGGTLALQRGWPLAQLVVRDERGNEQIIVNDQRPFAHPRFSPDGKRIAITIASGPRSDIWIYDIAGGTLSRLTEEGSLNERPEWSPDGSRVLFRSDQGPRSGIWWRPVDKSEPATPLLLHERADVFEAVLTPDGRGLVYQVDTIGADVMYMRVGDSLATPIAATEFPEDRARISPDGKWVALTSFSTGLPQVVVYSLDGKGGQVPVSTSNGMEPVWSRTGNRLFFRDGSKFVVASWEASPRFRVTSRTTLFDDDYLITPQPHAGYDISPDGSQFLLLKMVESSEVVVVQNLLAQARAGGFLERKQ